MIGKILTAGFCFVVLFAVFVAIRRRQRRAPGLRARVAAPSGGRGLFGLAPADTALLQSAAREAMERDRAQWGRDYVPGVSDSAAPGRIAGIPRTLRVRR
jgi:hypothetical protein